MLRRSSKVSLRGDSARDSFSSYLLKRSGGHEGHTTLRKKFQERFFVLQGTNLLYFRSQDEYLAGGASLGSLGVEGSARWRSTGRPARCRRRSGPSAAAPS